MWTTFLKAGSTGYLDGVGRRTWGISLLVVLVILVGCSQEPEARTAEEIVAERAQARWDALLQGDVATMYGFTSPAYRSGISQERYRARFGGAVRWTGAEVDEITCEEERCQVVVMVSYRAARERMENTRPIEETWILSEGQWWLHMK